ncbi:hybrid-cluster NAD(P)-dependent oxidoreductase [Ochrobactrum sp. BTU1]|uniref:hybrid-cluster NAD(P)-dependent oxidoreductase n=1 Tax=Ochrobactrum sp. BTU1 TaxID=2840456 RepID=UPI001C05AED8|nr:hybrid-cluster NAD(P)-dependent oxidoreductase [Ochrobactrum sp. BTU1]
MNTITSIDNDPLVLIAQIIFSMFVHIADADKSITPQEVRRFQNLLKDTNWIENEDLRAGANELRENYRNYWESYEDGKMLTSPDIIAQLVYKVVPQLGEDRSKNLRSDLSKLLEHFESTIYGVRFMRNEPAAKSLARQDIASILDAVRTAPAMDLIEMAGSGTVQTPLEIPTPVSLAAEPRGDIRSWTPGKTKVRCVDVIAETHDTKTYNFVAEQQVLFDYKPGQFVTIEVPLPGQTLRRSYTISSSPSRPNVLSITVKKVPMGWMSNWLYENMTEGFECIVNGPTGKFTCANHPSEKILFLAAGSGITPCMSMLRWLADTSKKTDVVFINNVRTPNDIIFHQELLYLSTRFGSRMRLAIVPSSLHPGQPWHGPIGTFNEELMRSYAPDFIEREIFVCGPPGYMQAAKNLFASLKFPMEHFHHESFGGAGPALPAAVNPVSAAGSAKPSVCDALPSIPKVQTPASGLGLKASTSSSAGGSAVATPPASAQKQVVLSTGGQSRVKIKGGESFIVEHDQSILEAAESCGVQLEHSCRSGVCGACKMRKISGKVEMAEGHVLSPEDVSEGLILTCIGRATGEVVIAPE